MINRLDICETRFSSASSCPASVKRLRRVSVFTDEVGDAARTEATIDEKRFCCSTKGRIEMNTDESRTAIFLFATSVMIFLDKLKGTMSKRLRWIILKSKQRRQEK